MAVIEVDRRRIEYQPAPEEHRFLVEGRTAWVEATLARACALGVILERHAWWQDDCSSFHQYVRRLGYPAFESHDLAWLGLGLRREPRLADWLRAGDVGLENACAVARLLSEGLLREGEDAKALALVQPSELRATVRRRLEERRQQAPRLEAVTVLLSPERRADFGTARRLASKRAGRALSESQTFGVVLDHYLDDYDPARKKARPRRVGPTSERPRDRYVPRAVQRELRDRSGGICEVGGCHRPFAALCHVTEHARGSGREARDLWAGCRGDHALYDAGRLRIVGWDEEGRPIFRDARGRIRRPDPRPPPPT